MSRELDEFFRCDQTANGWVFLVGVANWEGAHSYNLEWFPFREWKTAPTKERLSRARSSALAQRRFFRVCSLCHQSTNAGHMFDEQICQACAQGHLGIVF